MYSNDVYIKLQTVVENIVSLTTYESVEEIEKAVKSARYKEDQWIGGIFDALVSLREIPAADVEPVRHGYWVYKMRELIRYEDVTGTDPLGGVQTVNVKTHVRGPVPYCSLCNALAADSFLDYCPRCGAKMDGEVT